MKGSVAAVTLLFACSAFAFAEDFSANYIRGAVEVKESAGWYVVDRGDPIPAGGTVRLGPASFAELSNGSVGLSLSSQGTYRLPDIIQDAQLYNSVDMSGILSQRVASLVQRSVGRNSGADGRTYATETRGRGDDPAALIEQGLSFLKQGDYNEAYVRFKDAYDNAGASRAPEAAFYTGYAAALRNDLLNGIAYLSHYRLDPASDYYVDQLLTLAQLSVQTFAFSDAVKLLGPFLADRKGSPRALQIAYLLEGLAFNGMREGKKAVTALTHARDLVPGSAVSAAAGKLLASL